MERSARFHPPVAEASAPGHAGMRPEREAETTSCAYPLEAQHLDNTLSPV